MKNLNLILKDHNDQIMEAYENAKSISDFILDVEVILDDENYFDKDSTDFLNKLNSAKNLKSALDIINNEITTQSKKVEEIKNVVIDTTKLVDSKSSKFNLKLKNFKDNIANLQIVDNDTIIDITVFNTTEGYKLKYSLDGGNTSTSKMFDSISDVNEFLNDFKVKNPIIDEIGSDNCIIEFDNGDYVYVRYNEVEDSLEAGSPTNSTFLVECSIPYDWDLSLDDNLQNIYDECINIHPERIGE